MALEAKHSNLFSPQLVQDQRYNLMNPSDQGNVISAYAGRQMHFPGTLPGNVNSFYQPVVCESVQAKTSVNTEISGLTHNIAATRKRSRDSADQYSFAGVNFPATQRNGGVSQLPSFAGECVLPPIQQFQSEIDSIIFLHTKKIRLELEERQKQHAKLLAAAIGEGVTTKLKEKEDQIQKMGKLNFALQEKVKSLYVENQLWRDMAQTNEATANSLRSNLEQVLAANFGGEDRVSGGVVAAAAAAEEDAESCCGSSDDHGIRDVEAGTTSSPPGKESCYGDRRCRRCGDRESCVLLLPCRHLCLCNVCGSGSHQVQACPVCNSSMTATLHVNMSC